MTYSWATIHFLWGFPVTWELQNSSKHLGFTERISRNLIHGKAKIIPRKQKGLFPLRYSISFDFDPNLLSFHQNKGDLTDFPQLIITNDKTVFVSYASGSNLSGMFFKYLTKGYFMQARRGRSNSIVDFLSRMV